MKPMNYLSLDSGFSGLPALYFLDELAGRLQYDLGSTEEPLLCDHFDMIIGTGPGALDSMLLGRLRLPLSKAIEAYIKLSPVLSIAQAKGDNDRKSITGEFERVFSEVLLDAGFGPDDLMVENAGTKTVLCVSSTNNLSNLQLIRSYRARGIQAPPCTILQAARACVASYESLLPVIIGTGYRSMSLVGGMALCPNPSQELLREAQRAFGGDTEVGTIMSLGSGKIPPRRVSEMKNTINAASIGTESLHEELYSRLRETKVYFRFNPAVNPDLQNDLYPTDISIYLQEGTVSDGLDEVIKSIQTRTRGVKLKDINSIQMAEITLKPRPSLVQNFIGREDILEAMNRTHFIGQPDQLHAPAITVLSGLGGSGRTQIALKFALEFEKRFPGVSVHFVDASTEEKLKADLETIIRSLGTTYRSKSYEDALNWLATEAKNWLIILDNADDPKVHIFSFIPKCLHGSVIITTRNATYASLAPNSNHHVEGLSISEATSLLLRASDNRDSEGNRILAQEIIEEIGSLPLALAHAAGYIFVHQCLSTYLAIYRDSRAELLASTRPELPFDYRTSVATTIQMSVDRLSHEAREILILFSRLNATSIAHPIIVKAASRSFRHVVWSEESSFHPTTSEHADLLMKLFCTNGRWLESHFNNLILQCLQYSLLRLTSEGNVRFYSMHVLVQTYIQSNFDLVQSQRPGQLIARLLGSSITLGQDWEYFEFNRLLVPHIKQIDIDDVIEPGDYFGFGTVLIEADDGNLSIAYRERSVKLWKASLGEETPLTLAAMGKLANSYLAADRYQESVKVNEKVLEMQKKVLGPEDPETILTMGNLAASYSEFGRHEEALKLNGYILQLKKRIMGPDHPDTVFTMGNLAVSYLKLGRPQQALALQERVLMMQKGLLGADHPTTLHSMRNLLISLRILKLWSRLRSELEISIRLHEKVFGKYNAYTESMREQLNNIEPENLDRMGFTSSRVASSSMVAPSATLSAPSTIFKSWPIGDISDAEETIPRAPIA